jgi:hypothetical protein
MHKSAHLAGIVPVADAPKDFNFILDDAMIPVAQNYYAVEKAVYDCALAGCDTIWIVCNLETKPIIRKRMGDYTLDPNTVGTNKFAFAPQQYRKYIPIYYVSIPEKFYYKSYCLPWSILQGAMTSYNVSSAISKWTTPDFYYVSFPHSVYPSAEVKQIRKLTIKNKNVYFSYKNKTIKDNYLLPFTFDNEDFKYFWEVFKTIELSFGSQDDDKTKRERFTKEVGLDRLFDQYEVEGAEKVELSWSYEIDTWDKYCEFLGSEERKQVKFPGKIFISYHEWNPTAEDLANAENEEDDDGNE